MRWFWGAFISVFVLHSFSQFMAWSIADKGERQSQFWQVVSFPLFYLQPALADADFWTLAVLNSLVWALFAGLIVARITRLAKTQ